MKNTILVATLLFAGFAKAQQIDLNKNEFISEISAKKSVPVIAKKLTENTMAKKIEKQFSQKANLKVGNEGGGGGDLACDAKIRTIADNVHYWIQNRGPEVGNLNLSTSRVPNQGRPYTMSEYTNKMLDLFELPLNSSCVVEGDPGYPVKVGDASKVCVTAKDGRGLHMKCDQVKFLALSADEKIEQIHHEYAINLPGLEPVDGPISTYKISLQLAAYTETVVERRLAVAPAKPNSSSKSPFQIFKSAFDNAEAGRLEDFPLAKDMHKNNLRCAVVYPESIAPYSGDSGLEYVFGRVDAIVPGEGPLIPEKHISTMLQPQMQNEEFFSDGPREYLYFGFIEYVTFVNNNGDLQLDYTPRRVPTATSHHIYRKKGNLIFVHSFGTVFENSNEGESMNRYGYCYPVNQK